MASPNETSGKEQKSAEKAAGGQKGELFRSAGKTQGHYVAPVGRYGNAAAPDPDPKMVVMQRVQDADAGRERDDDADKRQDSAHGDFQTPGAIISMVKPRRHVHPPLFNFMRKTAAVHGFPKKKARISVAGDTGYPRFIDAKA